MGTVARSIGKPTPWKLILLHQEGVTFPYPHPMELEKERISPQWMIVPQLVLMILSGQGLTMGRTKGMPWISETRSHQTSKFVFISLYFFYLCWFLIISHLVICRGTNHQVKMIFDTRSLASETDNQPSTLGTESKSQSSPSESDWVVVSRIQEPESSRNRSPVGKVGHSFMLLMLDKISEVRWWCN